MTYRLNEEKMYLDYAEGMSIVIDFTSGGYFGFSSLGSLIVDKLAHGVSLEDVFSSVSVLQKCPDSFKKDLDDFANLLIDREILKEDANTVSTGAFKVEDAALADGFELKCIENTELQDLIMADPVHDVDPSAGWPFMK